MSWIDADIRANRDHFKAKLSATKQRVDVVHAIESGTFEFILLDTRPRDAFAFGHIKGAWSVPIADLDEVAKRLPRDREIVTYCWGHD